MSQFGTLLGRASTTALIVGLAAAVQAQTQIAVQFKSDIQVRDLDGKASAGKLYIGAAKQRWEFTASGETRPTIADPENGNQYTISPGQKKYVEMPIGESGGPVLIPKITPLDPQDPCNNGQYSDCMRLGAEMLNGFATQKWEYTDVDGERVTAWIATRLRFPIKTVAGNGATNELRNIVEGAQPANLFALPAGYEQADDLGGSGNSIADALASINPAMMQQALANAKKMEAEMKADPTRGARAQQWEAGAGYVLNFTITMRVAKQSSTNALGNTVRSNISMQYKASVPLNYGTPAVPPGVGPTWSVLALAGSGSRQAEALPATMNLEWEEQIQQHYDTGGCEGVEAGRSDTSTTVKGKASSSGSIITGGNALGMFQINGPLTAYNIFGGVPPRIDADIVSTSRTVDHCRGDRVTNTNENRKTPVGNLGQLQIELKDVPLPPTPAGLRGTQTVPLKFNFYEGPATVEWNFTPIAAR
jgi:hypothetical protein